MTDGSSQGLFVIVAVVIFGIFVFISYLLFRDTMKPALSKLFTDSFSQVNLDDGDNINQEGDNEPIENAESSKVVDGIHYVKIREEAPDKSESEVWIQAGDSGLGDGSLSINNSGTSEDSFNKGSGITGSISLPNNIDGKPVIGVGYEAFSQANFTGELIIPDNYMVIAGYAFSNSTFSGNLSLPKNLLMLADYAFENSIFSGSLELPDGISQIGDGVFNKSSFTGNLIIPTSLTKLGSRVFLSSRFSKVENKSSIRNESSGYTYGGAIGMEENSSQAKLIQYKDYGSNKNLEGWFYSWE